MWTGCPKMLCIENRSYRTNTIKRSITFSKIFGLAIDAMEIFRDTLLLRVTD